MSLVTVEVTKSVCYGLETSQEDPAESRDENIANEISSAFNLMKLRIEGRNAGQKEKKSRSKYESKHRVSFFWSLSVFITLRF